MKIEYNLHKELNVLKTFIIAFVSLLPLLLFAPLVMDAYSDNCRNYKTVADSFHPGNGLSGSPQEIEDKRILCKNDGAVKAAIFASFFVLVTTYAFYLGGKYLKTIKEKGEIFYYLFTYLFIFLLFTNMESIRLIEEAINTKFSEIFIAFLFPMLIASHAGAIDRETENKTLMNFIFLTAFSILFFSSVFLIQVFQR